MVLKKSKSENNTLFIDASKECIKVSNSNKLTDKDIQRILKAYTERKEVDHLTKVVKNSDIAIQEYNLSVSTHVEQKDTREVIDIRKLNLEIDEIVTKVNSLRVEIDKIIFEIEGQDHE